MAKHKQEEKVAAGWGSNMEEHKWWAMSRADGHCFFVQGFAVVVVVVLRPWPACDRRSTMNHEHLSI